NKDRRSADLVKAVNIRTVGGGILTDAVLRFTDQVIAFAELGGAGRADFGTCRWLAGSDAVRAHNAFADARIQRLPFIFRLAKHAGHHAIAAADTFPDVVDDGTCLCLMEGANGTN